MACPGHCPCVKLWEVGRKKPTLTELPVHSLEVPPTAVGIRMMLKLWDLESLETWKRVWRPELGHCMDLQPALVSTARHFQVTPLMEKLFSARPVTDSPRKWILSGYLALELQYWDGCLPRSYYNITLHKQPRNPKSIPAFWQFQCVASSQLCCHQFLKAVLPSTVEKENTRCALGEMKHGSPVITDRSFVSNSPSALLNVNLQCWHINLNDK